MKYKFLCFRNDDRKLQQEHIFFVETALGRKLHRKNEVHHVDGNGKNNANNNLVVCEDREYHHLLHMRSRSLKATGSPNNRHCSTCNGWFPKETFYKERSGLCQSCKKIVDHNRYLTVVKPNRQLNNVKHKYSEDRR